MNAAFPGNAPFLETVQPEFSRFTTCHQKVAREECVASAGIRCLFFVACHLAIFQGVVDMVHLKITEKEHKDIF